MTTARRTHELWLDPTGEEPMTTVRGAIERAIDCYDPKAAGAAADAMRARGLDYAAQFRIVHRIRPHVTLAEWDELLQEADSE